MTWNTVSLGSVCDVKTGKKDVNEGSKNGLYPFFTCAAKHTFSDVFSFDCEAILIAGNGAVGQTSYYNGKFEAYQRTYVLCNFIGILPQYLLYVLNGSLMYVLSSQVLGNTIPYIKKGMLTDFQVPLPSLATQQKIVAKLDAIFAEIDTATAAAEANTKNAEALFKSYLTNVFEGFGKDWKRMEIGTISKVINGYAFKSTDFNSDNGVKCIKITNVGIREFVEDTKEYLPNSFSVNHSNFLVKEGSIVIPLTRTVIGGGLKVAIVPPSFHNSLLNQRVASIEVMSEIVDSELIYYYLSSSIVTSYVLSHVNTLMQPNLSIKDLLLMPIPIPPIEIQLKIKNTISRNIDSIFKIKELNFKKIKECNLLKQSILQKAFSGELVKD